MVFQLQEVIQLDLLWEKFHSLEQKVLNHETGAKQRHSLLKKQVTATHEAATKAMQSPGNLALGGGVMRTASGGLVGEVVDSDVVDEMVDKISQLESQMQVVRESADLSVLVPGLQRFSQNGDDRPIAPNYMNGGGDTAMDSETGLSVNNGISPSSNLARGLRRSQILRNASAVKAGGKDGDADDEERVSSLMAHHHGLKENHNSVVEKLQHFAGEAHGKIEYLETKINKELDAHNETLQVLAEKHEENRVMREEHTSVTTKGLSELREHMDRQSLKAEQSEMELREHVKEHVERGTTGMRASMQQEKQELRSHMSRVDEDLRELV